MPPKFYKLKCPNSKTNECGCLTPNIGSLFCAGLTNKFIVRHEEASANTFIAFESFNEFISYRDNTPVESRCFHEVILGNLPQKIKFDLDYSKDVMHSTTASRAKNKILQIIVETFYQIYGNLLGLDDYPSEPIIVRSITKRIINMTNEHIVITNFNVPDNSHVQKFYKVLYDNLRKYEPITCTKYIDWNVNKPIQNLRLIGSCKLNKPEQIKHLHLNYMIDDQITEQHTIINVAYGTPSHQLISGTYPTIAGIITNTVEDFVLPDIDEGIEVDVYEPEMQKIIDVCNNKLDSKKSNKFSNIRKYNNTLILSYIRIKPSYCKLCNRVHDKDNTVYFVYNNFSVTEKCRHIK